MSAGSPAPPSRAWLTSCVAVSGHPRMTTKEVGNAPRDRVACPRCRAGHAPEPGPAATVHPARCTTGQRRPAWDADLGEDVDDLSALRGDRDPPPLRAGCPLSGHPW